jgi:chromosome segregation ATPase
MSADQILVGFNTLLIVLVLLLLLKRDYHYEAATKLSNSLYLLTIKTNAIMSAIQQVQAELTNLQTAIETERSQVSEALGKLNTTITQLQQQLADGASPEQLQELLNGLVSARENLQTIIPDEAPAN